MEELLASLVEDAVASSHLHIGQRIQLKGSLALQGTIRHIGPIHSAPGEYVGVELDRPLGKNDGTIDHVTYFLAKPKHGLFIRPMDIDVVANGSPAPVSAYVPQRDTKVNAAKGLKGSMWARSTQAQRLSGKLDGSPALSDASSLPSEQRHGTPPERPAATQGDERDSSPSSSLRRIQLGTPSDPSYDVTSLLVRIEETPIRGPAPGQNTSGTDRQGDALQASFAPHASASVRVSSALSGRHSTGRRPSTASAAGSQAGSEGRREGRADIATAGLSLRAEAPVAPTRAREGVRTSSREAVHGSAYPQGPGQVMTGRGGGTWRAPGGRGKQAPKPAFVRAGTRTPSARVSAPVVQPRVSGAAHGESNFGREGEGYSMVQDQAVAHQERQQKQQSAQSTGASDTAANDVVRAALLPWAAPTVYANRTKSGQDVRADGPAQAHASTPKQGDKGAITPAATTTGRGRPSAAAQTPADRVKEARQRAMSVGRGAVAARPGNVYSNPTGQTTRLRPDAGPGGHAASPHRDLVAVSSRHRQLHDGVSAAGVLEPGVGFGSPATRKGPLVFGSPEPQLSPGRRDSRGSGAHGSPKVQSDPYSQRLQEKYGFEEKLRGPDMLVSPAPVVGGGQVGSPGAQALRLVSPSRRAPYPVRTGTRGTSASPPTVPSTTDSDGVHDVHAVLASSAPRADDPPRRHADEDVVQQLLRSRVLGSRSRQRSVSRGPASTAGAGSVPVAVADAGDRAGTGTGTARPAGRGVATPGSRTPASEAGVDEFKSGPRAQAVSGSYSLRFRESRLAAAADADAAHSSQGETREAFTSPGFAARTSVASSRHSNVDSSTAMTQKLVSAASMPISHTADAMVLAATSTKPSAQASGAGSGAMKASQFLALRRDNTKESGSDSSQPSQQAGAQQLARRLLDDVLHAHMMMGSSSTASTASSAASAETLQTGAQAQLQGSNPSGSVIMAKLRAKYGRATLLDGLMAKASGDSTESNTHTGSGGRDSPESDIVASLSSRVHIVPRGPQSGTVHHTEVRATVGKPTSKDATSSMDEDAAAIVSEIVSSFGKSSSAHSSNLRVPVVEPVVTCSRTVSASAPPPLPVPVPAASTTALRTAVPTAAVGKSSTAEFALQEARKLADSMTLIPHPLSQTQAQAQQPGKPVAPARAKTPTLPEDVGLIVAHDSRGPAPARRPPPPPGLPPALLSEPQAAPSLVQPAPKASQSPATPPRSSSLPAPRYQEEEPSAALPAAGTPVDGRRLVKVSAMVRSYAGVCEQGYNASNPDKPCQDAICMVEHPESDGLLMAVFDGHGEWGHTIAQYFRERLPALVFSHHAYHTYVEVADNIDPPPSVAELRAQADSSASFSSPASKTGVRPPVGALKKRRNVAQALQESLATVEREVLSRTDVDCTLSGSTGCVVVVNGDLVTVANVGDSRCVLYRGVPRSGGVRFGQQSDQHSSPGATHTMVSPGTGMKGPAVDRLIPVPITIDHKPAMASETRRILLAGGRVHSIRYDDGAEGPVRVWVKDDDVPGLAMSRSLCDTVGKRAGVISTPDVYHYTLQPSCDAFLLLASDGLWEFTPSADVGSLLASTKADNDVQWAAFHAALEARQTAIDAGLPPEQWPAEPEAEPPAHLAVALDVLAEAAGTRWHQREGVIDDISIILAAIGPITGQV